MRARAARRGLASAAVTVAAAVTAALLPTAAHAEIVPGDPCATFEAPTRQPDPQLGGGVTVTTGQAGNLFAAGSAPSLAVTAPLTAAGQTLQLTVRDRSGTVATSAATLPVTSLPLPSGPGWFKVAVSRQAGDAVLGASCLWYGVAAAGAGLDLAALPAGTDWGGPGALRDVELHAQLGLPVVRRGIDLARFLATGAGDPDLAAAAARADQLGLKLVVQIGQGGPVETAAVADGSWESLVRRVVAANPAVSYWEAWNEPNTSMFFTGSVSDYVQSVLAPFARAVRAANPAAKVVGGTALSDDQEWWTSFARLGGFRLVDVVGVHPYTWGWGAPETDGMLDVLQAVRRLADANGGAGKPIFDTESGWPSAWQGTSASLWNQADFIARKIVLERALGVASGEFLLEGGWQDWDVIDMFRGVKPAAMTLSATSARLAGRSFSAWISTGVSGVYAARFSGLTAVWAATGTRSVRLSCTATGTDAYGVPVQFSGSVTATSSPVFLDGSGCLAPAATKAVAKPAKKATARKAAAKRAAAKKAAAKRAAAKRAAVKRAAAKKAAAKKAAKRRAARKAAAARRARARH